MSTPSDSTLALDFALMNDANDRAIQSPNGFTCTDGATSPQASPLSVDATGVTIVIPATCVGVTLKNLAASGGSDLRVFDSGGTAYFPVAPQERLFVASSRKARANRMAGQQNGVLVKSSSGTISVGMWFETI